MVEKIVDGYIFILYHGHQIKVINDTYLLFELDQIYQYHIEVYEICDTKDNELTLLNTEFGHVCEIISCLAIDIKLPFRISRLIFSNKTRKCFLSKKVIVN
jgi:hypothetical protein